MSLHPSLISKSKSRRHRSVLKRFERIKLLKEKDKWDESMSAFGLPKVKTLKIKKTKEAPPKEKEEAAASAPSATAAGEQKPTK
jgi:small basic protein (TIGR04137 family)